LTLPVDDKYYRGKSKEWSEDAIVADDEEEDPGAVTVKLEKRYSEKTAHTINIFDERLIPYELIVRLLEKLCFEDPLNRPFSAAILIFMPGIAEIRRLSDILSEHPEFGQENSFKIYPLHSTLSSENQSAVFDIPPAGSRKIVICKPFHTH
jgi:ATP-dependent RNA helicase DHX29